MVKETEYQKNVRLTREAAEESLRLSRESAQHSQEAAITDARRQREADSIARAQARAQERTMAFQAEAAYQSRRAAIAAEQTAIAAQEARELQGQALVDQRRAAFAMWVQSPDGIAFDAWRVRADALVARYEQNSATFEASWRQAKRDALGELSPAEIEAFRSGAYIGDKPKPKGAVNWGSTLGWLVAIVAVVALATMGITALFRGGDPLIGWEWPTGFAVAATVLFVLGGVASSRHPEWREQAIAYVEAKHAWDASNAAAKAAAMQDRLERFGFDPLIDPDWTPEPWTYDPHPGAVIDEFNQWARTGFPPAGTLPPLTPATVRDPQSEPVAGVRETLRQLSKNET